jgi:hypothetical protein
MLVSGLEGDEAVFKGAMTDPGALSSFPTMMMMMMLRTPYS